MECGQSKKVLEASSDYSSLQRILKEAFEIDSEIIIQKYEADWEDFVNLVDFELLKTYLKGSKKQKEQLRKDIPADCENFDLKWPLRERHLQKDLPLKYVFNLLSCYQSDCVHPLCKEGKPDKEPCWFPGGPL